MSLCSLDDPFSNLSVSREHLRAMDAVVWCNGCKSIKKKKIKKNLIKKQVYTVVFTHTDAEGSVDLYNS